jgi:hypothetical protein
MQVNDDRRMTIAVLEDNPDRIAEMDRLLAENFPLICRTFARSAGQAIAWLEENWSSVICICLDHDLEPSDTSTETDDPGTGRIVSDFLIGKLPICPVVIHTSNQFAAIAMEADLVDAGWSVSRVTPFENLEWLAKAWLPLVRNAIVQTAIVTRSPRQGRFGGACGE